MDMRDVFSAPYGGPVSSYVKVAHWLKMAKKQRQRLEAGDRRTAAYERMKADAHRVVLKMRTWLKSPYAFRRGGL